MSVPGGHAAPSPIDGVPPCRYEALSGAPCLTGPACVFRDPETAPAGWTWPEEPTEPAVQHPTMAEVVDWLEVRP